MRKFIYILLLYPLLCVGCSSNKIISDDELADIFHDAFVVNAYTGERKMKLDSLNIYEPIFASYGYTVDDVHYTIGNFSKRKSARLGDVVERAIVKLELEGLKLMHEVAILDTVRYTSQRRMRQLFELKDLMLVTSQRDSLDLRLFVSPAPRGEYTVSFDYLIDSLDENVGTYRTISWLSNCEDETTSRSMDRNRRQRETISYLQRDKVLTHSKMIEAGEDYLYLTIELVNFLGKKKEPHIKIRDVRVEYTPLAERAEEMIFERMVNLNIFSDELFPPRPTKDSL